LSYFQNKKIRYFDKKKIKLISFFKKPKLNKFLFYNKINNKNSDIFYYFKKKNFLPDTLNLFSSNFNLQKNYIIKFKNINFNFYITNVNRIHMNFFFNFILFYLKINIHNKTHFILNNKINYYFYLFFNSWQFLFESYFSNTSLNYFNIIKKNSINYNTFHFFNLNRNLNKIQTPFTFNNTFLQNKLTYKNKINFKKYNRLIYIRFKLLKINANRKLYSLMLSKFFFQNLYKSIDQRTNTNLILFKLQYSDWINPTLARLTKFSTNFLANDFLSFKSFLTINNNSNQTPHNLVNLYNFNDTLLEKFYLFSHFTNTKIFSFYNFFSNQSNNLNSEQNHFNLKRNSNSYLNVFKNKLKFNFFKNLYFYSFNKNNFLFFFFFKPLFFKTLIINDQLKSFILNTKYLKNLNNIFTDTYFYTSKNFFFNNNLIPNTRFLYFFKKKIIKIFSYSKFSTTTSLWNYNSLVRFLEFSSGKKVCIKFFNFLVSLLDFYEKAQCLLWSQKVKYFRKVLGPRLFLNESIQIIYLALKLKDPYFLSNWMVSTMYKISFWKYKTFLRYIKYVLRYFFWVIFKDLKIKGIKFQLKGKVSVAGNARTRTVFQNVGYTSHTTFNNKILYNLNLVRSFTGVMGLKLWIVF
jgi:hypothetical protein